jgi:signal-transduction protein with cAMP-binding, CBS, and nucleotidyltransferase domain
MKCNDLMNMDLRWVQSDATVTEAARLMRDSSIGFLLVCDTPGRLVGVVTDRDLTIRVSADGKSPSATLVAEAMSQPVVTCLDSDYLTGAEELMQERKKCRLVVLDRAGTPVGVLSLTEILGRDRPGRAAQTARGVLSRDAGGPHQPIEEIGLTPSSREDEERAAHTAENQPSVAVGGHWSGSLKEFP